MRKTKKEQEKGQDEHKRLLDYFHTLQAHSQDQESKFDNAVLLITGGALTLSAAFVAQLLERVETLKDPGVLKAAWIAWCVGLACSIGSFLLSASQSRKLQNKISDGAETLESSKYTDG